jgi:DNA-binding response OmpR family regulator
MIGRVLIIDDEKILRETLTRVLNKAGCDTKAAPDGPKALELIDNQMFDLVYLDIHMPKMDGLQILKEIRNRDSDLPVILLTGYATLQSAVEALRLGATDYLLKPFDPEVVVARTRVVIDEQVVFRRKQEIREQILTLQQELNALERVSSSHPGSPLPAPNDRFLKQGRLILDLQALKATFGEKVLTLPPTAFDYLVVLAKHSPEVVAYQNLVAEAQDYQVEASEARELAKWHVHVLRQELESNPKDPQFVLNVRGVGYRLLVD